MEESIIAFYGHLENRKGSYSGMGGRRISVKSTESRELFDYEKEKLRLEQMSTERRLKNKIKIPGERLRQRSKMRILARQRHLTPQHPKYQRGSPNSAHSFDSDASGALDSALFENKGKITRTYNHLGKYKFKNEIDYDTKVNVGLDLLHTDELMKYYREVLSKSKKDFVVHQRQ